MDLCFGSNSPVVVEPRWVMALRQKLGADFVGDGLAEMYMYVYDVISSVSGVGGCVIGDLEEQWERCFHVMMLRLGFLFGNFIGL